MVIKKKWSTSINKHIPIQNQEQIHVAKKMRFYKKYGSIDVLQFEEVQVPEPQIG
jgi:hypothetical protein